MTVYNDLTPDEQQLLRASLAAAAVAISAASPGRDEETVSEGFAAASFVLGSRAAHVGHPLVSSVILALEERARDETPFPDYLQLATRPDARQWAAETLRAVAALLDARADPGDSAAYRRWLLDIASTVAAAGKEDQGFLGRGGVTVNAAEREALLEVAATLGLNVQLPEGGTG